MKKHYDFTNAVVMKNGLSPKTKVESALKKRDKELISLRFDRDVLEFAKKKAKAEGIGYQTWLNMHLRRSLLGDKSIEARLAKLEKAVLGKKKSS